MKHRDALQPSCIDKPAEAIPTHDESGEQRRQNAERKCNGEASHRAGRLPKKNRRCDQGRYVGVEN